MPEPRTLLLFALSAVVLIAIPGPNLLYLVTRSVNEGRRAGIASAFGLLTGTFVHITAAATGLSALLASSATAFDVVRYLGAGYLVYLGIRTLRARGGEEDDGAVAAAPRAVSLWRAYRQAVVVQLLNPKVALFFLAFLPQFVDPARGAVAPQVLVLGAVLASLGLANDCLYAVAAGSLGARLRRRPRATRRVTGAIYLALGAVAAAVR